MAMHDRADESAPSSEDETRPVNSSPKVKNWRARLACWAIVSTLVYIGAFWMLYSLGSSSMRGVAEDLFMIFLGLAGVVAFFASMLFFPTWFVSLFTGKSATEPKRGASVAGGLLWVLLVATTTFYPMWRLEGVRLRNVPILLLAGAPFLLVTGLAVLVYLLSARKRSRSK